MTAQSKPDCIYCIGDSHVSFFAGANAIQPIWPDPSDNRIPFFNAIRTGAVLAYNLGQFGTTSQGREKLTALLDPETPTPHAKVPQGSLVLLGYGEIDCRCHVIPQAKKRNKSVEEIVDVLAERYCKVISEVKDWGLKPMVWNAIASSPKNKGGTKEFPIVGPCIERNRITRYFNQRVGLFCEREAIPFVDIFDDLVDEHGITRPELLMDDIHLSQLAMPLVLNWLRKNMPGIVPEDYSLPESSTNPKEHQRTRDRSTLGRLLSRVFRAA